MNPESKTLAILGIFQVGHYVQITRVTVSEGRKCLTTWGQMPRGSCVQEVTQIQNSGRISGLGCRFFSSGPHVPSPVGFPALLCPAFHPDISPLCQPLLGSQTRVLAPFDQQAAGKRRSGCFLPGSSLILFSISVGSPPCSAMTAPWVMLPSGLFSRTWDRSGLREHSFL